MREGGGGGEGEGEKDKEEKEEEKEKEREGGVKGYRRGSESDRERLHSAHVTHILLQSWRQG